MKWFKHDSNAQNDAKLRKLKTKYGMSGYGLYWHCIELIAGHVDSSNLTFELEHDSEIIAEDTGISADLVQEMMEHMIDLRLFEKTDEMAITCMKLALRLDETQSKNPEMKKIRQRLMTKTPERLRNASGKTPSRREEKRIEIDHSTSPSSNRANGRVL